MAKFSKGPWRPGYVSIRGRKVPAVRNSHRDPVAIVYTTEDDARLLAASLRLLGSLKHMVAIVRMHEADLRASERAKLADAQALIAEVSA